MGTTHQYPHPVFLDADLRYQTFDNHNTRRRCFQTSCLCLYIYTLLRASAGDGTSCVGRCTRMHSSNMKVTEVRLGG